MTTRRHEVIYDADCGFCESTRRLCERLDWLGRFEWRALQDPGVYRDHPSLTRAACETALHLVRGLEVLTGFAAIRFLLRRFPLTMVPSLVLWLPGISQLGNWVYRWIARRHRSVLFCPVGQTSLPHRLFASAWIVLVLSIVLAGPVLQVEDWPLTCAPMFATPIEEDFARYSFRFTSVDRKGRSREVPSRVCGVPELRLKRLFFGRFYGSVDSQDPYAKFPEDTPEQFEKRMSDFFRRFVSAARARGNLLETVRVKLVVVREARGRQERSLVGTYDVSSGRFRRAS